MSILDSFRLDGDVAVVTGAGTGIGRGIALGLADAGAAVVVVARRGAMVEAVAEQVRAGGGRALAVTADVTDDDQVQRVIDATVAELGRLDVWVNNAGGLQGERPALLRQHTPESFDAIVALNLRAVWRGCVLAQAAMAEGGRIINVSSIAGLRHGTPFNGPYGLSKAAVNHMTATLALELARRRIRVNAIAPGPVDTEDMRESISADDVRMAALANEVPLGRLGQDADFGAAAVYLASRASAWVTGHVLVVSGGAPTS
jgi:7-alpha-hydroxysteroid dehydrogenase